jgi:hypothetical protein
VDHFFPWILLTLDGMPNVDGIWNLVLSCASYNRGEGGKSAKVPEIRFLERLHRRNSFLINSHHPLRETLMNQTGETEPERRAFLQGVDRLAINYLVHRWAPPDEAEAAL